MKKIIISALSIVAVAFISVAALGMYKFNYLQDGIYIQMKDGSVISSKQYDELLKGVHPSWDRNNDGINDCEADGSCDHSIDYKKPRLEKSL